MRCLYCGKKLSLLKLAKGDSFCSPEHFDAFQLQESKSAFERLMSLGEPEAPKAPLISKAVEPEARPVQAEAKPIIAEAEPVASASTDLPRTRPESQPVRIEPRKTNLESRSEPVEPAQVVENKEPAGAPAAAKKAEAPPCAPFSDQGRPMFFDAPLNIASSEESENPILPEAQQVTWPIHAIHEAEGILNLHLQVRFAGVEPAARDSKREFLAEDEPFATIVEHPLMDAKPELPEIECVEPSEAEPLTAEMDAPAAKTKTFEAEIEPAAEIKTPAEIEPTGAMATIEAPLLEGKALDDKRELSRIECLAALESDASATKIETHVVETEGPADETQVAAEIDAPAEIETPRLDAIAPAVELEAPAAELEAPAVELEAPIAELEIAAKVEPPRTPSIPYLLSPSFLARSGTSRFLDPSQALIVNSFAIPSTLGKREIPGIDARQMPRYTRPVKTAPVAARNFVVHSAATVAELPAGLARTLPPVQKNGRGAAWTLSNRLITIPVRTLNAISPKPRAADFDLPRPASFLVRPDPASIRAIDPQKIARGLDTKSALRSDLETVPAEAVRAIFPAGSALEGAVSTMLPQSIDHLVCPRFPWKSSTAAIALEYRIATHEITQTPALPARDYTAAPLLPAPYQVASPAHTPWLSVSQYLPLASRQLDAFLEGRPVAYGPIVHISTKPLGLSPIPQRSLPGRTVSFRSDWKAHPPEPFEMRNARFLPVRDVQRLPAARPWPKLGALPR